MAATKGRIDRVGRVHFTDAALGIWEDGIGDARKAGGWEGAQAWERQFKRDVFARIVQLLHRLGWTTKVGTHIFEGENARYCRKGDLQGDLLLQGRHIEFKMFQEVNTPTRPDNGGRYEWDKEGCMPYVLRLEMERTRRRIRDYLCNVFTGYVFEPNSAGARIRPLQFTAMERIQRFYAESWHFKGDWAAELKKEASGVWYNRKSANGSLLNHEQRVWFFDRKGRIATGQALYADGMWWVVTGRYDYTKLSASELYTSLPENLRVKRNAGLRRKRLEQEMAKAIKGMNFERAARLRDVLFPPGTGPLFHVRVKSDGMLWGPNSSGYTRDTVAAGKYTSQEAERIVRGAADRLEAVEAAAA